MKMFSGSNQYQLDNFILDYHLSLSSSDKLIVFSPGFIERSKFPYPYFQRMKWSQRLNENCLFLCDPTTLIGNTKIGWFIGDKNSYYLPIIANFIRDVAYNLKIDEKNILFFGSSAGGFSSIAFASYLKGAQAFAINPQTNALKLHDAQQLANTLKSCFGTSSLISAKNMYFNRLDLISIFEQTGNVPKMTIWQNFYDKYHYIEHLLPFLMKLESSKEINDIGIVIASNPEIDHSPPDLDEIKDIMWGLQK